MSLWTFLFNKYYSDSMMMRFRRRKATFLSSFLLFFQLSLLPLSYCQSEPFFLNRSENTSAVVGEEVTFICEVGNLGARKVVWTKVNERRQILLLHDDPFTSDTRYIPVVSSTGVNLRITQLQRYDDALYECSVQSLTSDNLMYSVSLTILVPPGQPTITLTDAVTADLTEGQMVVLACSSTGGNPPPLFTWSRNNERIGEEFSRTIQPVRKFSTTQSLLTWQLSRDDHRARFICSVSNPSIPESLLSDVKQYNVKYAPVLTVGSFNPLVVTLGSSVPLTCTPDAFPNVTSLEWKRNNLTISRTGSLMLISVTREDAGQYSCVGSNFATRTEILNLDIQYPPTLAITPSSGTTNTTHIMISEESPAIVLNCSVNANPSVDKATIVWSRSDIPSWQETGPTVRITSISRQMHGISISCQGTNTLTPSGGSAERVTGRTSVQLDVLYKPGPATIEKSTQEVIMNQELELKCIVPDLGNPPGRIMWSFGDVIFEASSTYRINSTRLQQSGNYSCLARNSIGTGQLATILVDVMEPPEWLTLPPVRSISANSGEVATVVVQLAVTCSVHGKPPPQIVWTLDDKTIDPNEDFFHHRRSPIAV